MGLCVAAATVEVDETGVVEPHRQVPRLKVERHLVVVMVGVSGQGQG